MDTKNLNIGRPSTYATIIDKIISRKYVEIKDIEGKDVELNKYNVNKSNPKSINMEVRNIKIGKEKRKLVPTFLGRKATEFLEKYFENLMDYNFTANMEKQLDEVADGNLNKNKIIKSFYDYLTLQIDKLKKNILTQSINNLPSQHKINDILLGKTSNDISIYLSTGKYGKYLICGDNNINLKYLIPPKSKITEYNIQSHSTEIIKLVEEKLSNESNKSTNENLIKNHQPMYLDDKTEIKLLDGKFGKYLVNFVFDVNFETKQGQMIPKPVYNIVLLSSF